MRSNHASSSFVLLLACAAPACLTRAAGADRDPVPDGGIADAPPVVDASWSDDRPSAPKLPPPERHPLGAPCSAPADCASGFCADGVCCDAACDATCYACNLPGREGACAPLDAVEDLAATATCSGTRVCAVDPFGAAACKLRDGEACVASDECATGACRTYLPDEDGDGFGSTGSPAAFNRCDPTPMPPTGFTTSGGDCCDIDPGAHPSVAAYSTSRDRCGSFDWNCSGVDEKQQTGVCPSANNQPAACGTACSVVFKGTVSTLYVQACR